MWMVEIVLRKCFLFSFLVFFFHIRDRSRSESSQRSNQKGSRDGRDYKRERNGNEVTETPFDWKGAMRKDARSTLQGTGRSRKGRGGLSFV